MNCFISDDTNIMNITMQGSAIIENNIKKVSHPFIWISFSFSVKLNSFLTRLKNFYSKSAERKCTTPGLTVSYPQLTPSTHENWAIFLGLLSQVIWPKLLTICYLSWLLPLGYNLRAKPLLLQPLPPHPGYTSLCYFPRATSPRLFPTFLYWKTSFFFPFILIIILVLISTVLLGLQSYSYPSSKKEIIPNSHPKFRLSIL